MHFFLCYFNHNDCCFCIFIRFIVYAYFKNFYEFSLVFLEFFSNTIAENLSNEEALQTVDSRQIAVICSLFYSRMPFVKLHMRHTLWTCRVCVYVFVSPFIYALISSRVLLKRNWRNFPGYFSTCDSTRC